MRKWKTLEEIIKENLKKKKILNFKKNKKKMNKKQQSGFLVPITSTIQSQVDGIQVLLHALEQRIKFLEDILQEDIEEDGSYEPSDDSFEKPKKIQKK